MCVCESVCVSVCERERVCVFVCVCVKSLLYKSKIIHIPSTKKSDTRTHTNYCYLADES